MGSIFTEHVFPRYVGRQVMKPQMNGFNDPTLRDFSLLDSSVLMKEKLKGEMFEEEFIRSFLNAAKELAAARKKGHRPTWDVRDAEALLCDPGPVPHETLHGTSYQEGD